MNTTKTKINLGKLIKLLYKNISNISGFNLEQVFDFSPECKALEHKRNQLLGKLFTHPFFNSGRTINNTFKK